MYPARLMRDLAVQFHRVFRGRTQAHETFRDRLAQVFIATLVVDLIAAAVMCWVEQGKVHPGISSFFTSFFWVTTQLLTVSSQMQNPVTTMGRIVDMILQIWAISVVAALAGSFAAFLLRERPPPS
jgi:TctA family transporter